MEEDVEHGSKPSKEEYGHWNEMPDCIDSYPILATTMIGNRIISVKAITRKMLIDAPSNPVLSLTKKLK